VITWNFLTPLKDPEIFGGVVLFIVACTRHVLCECVWVGQVAVPNKVLW